MDTYSKSDPSPSEQTVGIGGTIREAAAILKSAQQGLVPVIGVNGAVIGVVGDDDIRRWLGDGRSLAEPLSSVIEGVPILAREGEQKAAIVERMRVANQPCLPIVDAKGQFVRLGYMDRPTVPNCIPCLEGREQEYAAEAIAGGWLAVGPFIQRFEGAIAAFTGAAHAVAVINGTAALQLALVCAGVKPGDLVLLPTLTFAATANAVRHCGATPMFFDVEPVSWGIDAGQLARYLERDCVAKAGSLLDRSSGARIGAVMPVHLYGHPVDLDPIVELAERYGIPLVEDGAEALGARYKDRRVGSLHRVCCLSFNGNKIITGGNGGMILTDDAGFARRARYLAAQARDDATEFVHGDIGYNYRLPNLNAAVALAQAEKLEEFLGRKRRIVERYAARFEATPGIGMWREAPWATSSCWMAILSVDEQRHPGAIAKLRRFLPMRGIEARPVWQPLHRQKPFAAAPHAPIEVAERLYRTGLCLPCSAGLTVAELDCVAQTIDAFFALQAL